MKNKHDKRTFLDKTTELTKNSNRVFARLLSRPLTELETNQVSGGTNNPNSGNGRWLVTDNKKIIGWDWYPN